MVKRMTVTLEQDEYSTLVRMAIDDLRSPSDELRHILRLEIERRYPNLIADSKKADGLLTDTEEVS
jgi:hypothetical protein